MQPKDAPWPRGGFGAAKTCGAASPRAQAPMRKLGDGRLRRLLCGSASRPIFRIRRDIGNVGLGHRPTRWSRIPTGRFALARDTGGRRWAPVMARI